MNKIKKHLNKHNLEIAFAALATVTFLVHLGLILLAKSEIINNSELAKTSFIAAITTPFTIILIYEIIELVFSLKKPLVNSLVLQFEIISLIYVRNIFKTFADLETLENGFLEELFQEIVLILVIGIIIFVGVKLMTRMLKNNKGLISTEPKPVKKIKNAITIVVIIGVILVIINYFSQFNFTDFIYYGNEKFKLTALFQSVFTLMILADIVNFLLTFFYNDKYSELFRNAVYILAAIIIRLSVAVPQPFDVLLVGISIIITLAITYIQIKLPEDC